MAIAIGIYLFGTVWVYASYLLGMDVFVVFGLLYAVTFVLVLPKRAISPLAILYLYYGVWFVVAPMFAEKYQGDVLNLPEYRLAIAFCYSVFGLGVIAIKAGERFARRLKLPDVPVDVIRLSRLRRIVLPLYVFCTLMIVMIVLSSGGFARWIANPGDAFLNREGSGVFVILSHFSSLPLAILSGYWSYRSNSKLPLAAFLVWVALTSPVHGSKGQIALLVVLSVVPWLRNMRLFSTRSVALYISLLGIFFLGIYFRNLTWIDTQSVIPYALNYFTALENLAISIRDFDPQFMRTFFLPFVKFLTPFGLKDPTMYFDMNHMLTDYYYPWAWEIRATEQWPVETDLYLNFYFFGGLPLVAAYLFVVGAVFSLAVRRNSVGGWFVATIMTIFMLSHVRGSLLNHTDFYMYPYLILAYFGMRRFVIEKEPLSQPATRAAALPAEVPA